ncbi:MAG: phospholipase D-like domain-containing protein [Acutalibacteraceae bacterium]
MDSNYFKCSNIKGDLYFGKGAGKHIEKAINAATKSIKIVVPYISHDFLKKLVEKQISGVDVTLITLSDNFYQQKQNIYPLISQERIVDAQIVECNKRARRLSIIRNILIFAMIIMFVIVSAIFLLFTDANDFQELTNNFKRWFSIVASSVYLFLIILAILSSKINYQKDHYYIYHQKLNRVKIFKSGSKSKQIIHSKIYVIDDVTAYIGSLNFTYNGFYLNKETCITINDRDTVNSIADYIEAVYNDSEIACSSIKDIARLVYIEP